MNKKDFLIFNLSGSKELGEKVCKIMNIKKGNLELNHFKDGEIHLRLLDSVRAKNVYVIQSTSTPVNDNLMELLIFCDVLRRSSAKTINVIMPYFGYSRQDRISNGREPITAKIVTKVLEAAGVNHLITFDIHANQIQGFFDISNDNVPTLKYLIKDIPNHHDISNMVVLSPDLGSVKRANVVAEYLNLPLAIISKSRKVKNDVEIDHIIGDIDGKDILIVDDMIDTGNTLLKGLEKINNRINSVIIAATHGIFSIDNDVTYEQYFEKYKKLKVKKIYVTNSISQESRKNIDLLEIIDISPYISKLIKITEGLEEGTFSESFSKKWN